MTRTELEKMNRAELMGIADSILLKNRSPMTKAALIQGILDAQESDLQRDAEIAAEDAQDGGDEKQPVVSIEDYRKIHAAPTQKLQELLASGSLDGSPERREAVERELLERRELDKPKSKLQERTFRITKGGRIWVGGCPFDVPVGAVVSRLTHDLGTLKGSGIEMVEVTEVETRLDQFDRPVTVAT
jgi:hypothetical protein